MRQETELYFLFGKNRYKAYCGAGWYRGEEFILFRVTLFEKYGGWVELFGLQIAKFLLSFGGHKVD